MEQQHARFNPDQSRTLQENKHQNVLFFLQKTLNGVKTIKTLLKQHRLLITMTTRRLKATGSYMSGKQANVVIITFNVEENERRNVLFL